MFSTVPAAALLSPSIVSISLVPPLEAPSPDVDVLKVESSGSDVEESVGSSPTKIAPKPPYIPKKFFWEV